MAELKKKKGKFIARDSSNNLVQGMPKTKAEYVSYENKSLKDAIEPLESKDVKEMLVELDTQQKTETSSRIEKTSKYLVYPQYGSGYNFHIHFVFGYKYVDSVEVVNRYDILVDRSFYDENTGEIRVYPNVITGRTNYSYSYSLSYNVFNSDVPDEYYKRSNFKSNVDYYIDFNLQPNVEYESMYFDANGFIINADSMEKFFDEMYDVDYTFHRYALGYMSGESIYEPWSSDLNLPSPLIKVSLPAEGQTKTWMINLDYDDETETSRIIPVSQRCMRLSLTGFGNNAYRATFRWVLEKTVNETTTTKWSNLKTTLVKNDNSVFESSNPISGIVCNIEGSASFDDMVAEQHYPERNGTFQGSLFIADGSEPSQDPLEYPEIDYVWPQNIQANGALIVPATDRWHDYGMS